jgi:hypothetical protein
LKDRGISTKAAQPPIDPPRGAERLSPSSGVEAIIAEIVSLIAAGVLPIANQGTDASSSDFAVVPERQYSDLPPAPRQHTPPSGVIFCKSKRRGRP